MCGRGVIHVFIGAPVIAPGEMGRSVSEGRTALWEEVPFTHSIQGVKHTDRGVDGGSSERSKHGGSGCVGDEGPEEPGCRACDKESDRGQTMETCNKTIISELVSCTELCHISHNLQRPGDHDGCHDYGGAEQCPGVISENCPAISAETEFLTVLTSSQLAVKSPETDGTEAANRPTSENETQDFIVENITSASQEGFPCSSDLFTDASDEEVDGKSLQSLNRDEELHQKSLQSLNRGEELHQKSLQSLNRGEELNKRSLQFPNRGEELHQKSLQSLYRGEDQKSLQSLYRGEDQKSLQFPNRGEELNKRSLQSLNRGEELHQKSLQSLYRGEDQKSLQFLNRGEELHQKSLQSMYRGEEQKSLQFPNRGKELDKKSLQSFYVGEEPHQKSLYSLNRDEEHDKKSIQFPNRGEKLYRNSLKCQKSDEKVDKKSFKSWKSFEKLGKKSLKSQISKESSLHIDGESHAEQSNNGDYLVSESIKRKKALPASSPSSKHEQQSKKSKPSTSPVKSPTKRSRDRQKTPPKPLTLLKCCLAKNIEYNIMAVVLQPCHVKEVKVRSGSHMGSALPLATIDVMDQSGVERKVLMWRTAAFWSLALLPGEIIVLTNLSVCEDRWNKDPLLQSSFRSKLINLGSCSTLSGPNSDSIESSVKELLDYIHKKHYYLSVISPRQAQSLDHIEFVSLAELQPELLVHSVLKVDSISVLKEATYIFKGLQQNKIILTVEQVQGQTSILVLWGTCASWYDQLHLKRDHIWVFKYLFCKKNIISGELELHTTPWSSCECLFDDDQRAVDFRKKYNTTSPKQMSLLTMIEDRYSGEIQVKGSILQIEFHIPGKHKILISREPSISHILKLLPDIIYSGCGKCKRELNIDDNNVYEQCHACLPFNQVRILYRSAQMTITSDGCCVRVQVPPDILENIFLSIPPSLLPKAFPSYTDITYGTIVADLCRSLLAQTGETFVFTIRSQFVLDENSVPLEEDFHLSDFHLDL